ncbi:MAG: hypothetical protein WC824_05625 [Bacteroidota bacterium]|jgi:M6 family metalloprotease-like protein
MIIDHGNRSRYASDHPSHLISFLLITLIIFTVRGESSAQSLSPQDAITCGMREGTGAGLFKSIDNHGGAHLPADGTITGMVVFVQTLNDMGTDPNWPLGSMPTWASEYSQRLQRYFSDMSGGRMQLQLDVLPDLMMTRGTEDGYVYWHQNYGSAIKEIIDSLDTNIDFSDYDRWDSEGRAYRLLPGADGQVDLLIFIFRSITNSTFLPFSGVSDLGFAGYQFLDGSLARWVYGGSGQFNDASASGLTVCRSPGSGTVIDQDFAFRVSIHEFGHKLFGEGHPAELFGGLGLMANGGNGYAMNSFERQLAGYIDFHELTPGVDTVVTLHDYVTTGEAVLLAIPDVPRAYYSLEYRTRRSEWDSAPVSGIYAYRIYDSWSKNQKEVHVVSAEGKYDWALDSATGTIHPQRPAPLTGYSRLERIPINGKNYWADCWWGDERIAFTLDRPEFSVLKNPTPDFISGTDTISTNLHITVLSADTNSASVRISYQDPKILATHSHQAMSLALWPPYPHPLREKSNGMIPFSVGRAGRIQLNLYDALGRRLRTLLESEVAAGANHVMLTTEGLSAGIYQIVLESTEGCKTQTIVITR